MNIQIPKYNTKNIELTIKNYTSEIDELNFVVEDCSKNTIFKKTLDDGIVLTDTNKYTLSIEADDTKDMSTLLTYKFFIEIIIDKPTFVETKLVGDFVVTESSTSLGEELND